MDEREFIVKADACLQRVAKWLEDFDPDEVDYNTADGSVTMEFPDGAKFILSRQPATHQMWLAAASRGYHFDYAADDDSWVDDKDGVALGARLAEILSEKIGRAVEFE